MFAQQQEQSEDPMVTLMMIVNSGYERFRAREHRYLLQLCTREKLEELKATVLEKQKKYSRRQDYDEMLRQIEAMLPSVVPSKRGSAVPSTPRETFGVNQAAYDTLCKKIQVEFTRLRALSQDCMSIGAHQKIVNIESALDRLETHLRTHLRENINEETMLDYCRVGGISLAQRLAEPRYCSFFTCISKADDALTGVRQLSANETKPLLQ